MALRAKRFDRYVYHQREAPKNACLLSVKLCGILCVTLCPMATCLTASCWIVWPRSAQALHLSSAGIRIAAPGVE
jgi:hypothetical protein